MQSEGSRFVSPNCVIVSSRGPALGHCVHARSALWEPGEITNVSAEVLTGSFAAVMGRPVGPSVLRAAGDDAPTHCPSATGSHRALRASLAVPSGNRGKRWCKPGINNPNQ